VLIAAPMVAVLAHYATRFSARALDVTLDSNLLWVGGALALIAGVFLAYVPRLPSSDVSRRLGLSGSGGRATGGSKRLLRMFAVAQVIAAFSLLAGAGALLTTLMRLEKTQPPFETAHVLAVDLPVTSYGRTPQQVRQFYRDVQQRIGTLPGVERVSTGFSTPWRDGRQLTISLAFAVEGAKRDDSQDLRARFRSVAPGYFETLGVPILEGRDFRDADRDGAEPVVIISRSVGEQLFPGRDAVGRHLRWTDSVIKFIGISGGPRRIIGVVPDYDDENIIPLPSMKVYQPVEQEGFNGRLFVRAHKDPYALVPAISRIVHQMAADQPIEQPSTLDDIRAEVLSPDRLNAIVFGGFAGLALLISVVGVAGVLAFSVSGRTREFGIRLALGAQPGGILAQVLLEGLVIAVVGVAAGLLIGLAGERLIGGFLADFRPPGAMTLLVSAAVIMAAALIASALPAVRASRVDAIEALRSE
jgi:putative ABC transport system permease protein